MMSTSNGDLKKFHLSSLIDIYENWATLDFWATWVMGSSWKNSTFELDEFEKWDLDFLLPGHREKSFEVDLNKFRLVIIRVFLRRGLGKNFAS